MRGTQVKQKHEVGVNKTRFAKDYRIKCLDMVEHFMDWLAS